LVIFWDNAYFLKIWGKLTVLESNGLLWFSAIFFRVDFPLTMDSYDVTFKRKGGKSCQITAKSLFKKPTGNHEKCSFSIFRKKYYNFRRFDWFSH
jgi:hypothetical protein